MGEDSKEFDPKANKDKSSILPVDLQIAIKHARLQYKHQLIKKYTGYSDRDQIMSFIPDPHADESWAVGGQILFCNPDPGKEEEVIDGGEILEVDPETGRIFLYIPDLKERDISSLKLVYKPFDFAEALQLAFTRLETYPEVLFDALNKVLGGEAVHAEQQESAGETEQIDRGILDIWGLPWSILWGPPGTGKTQNVANAVASHVLSESAGKVLIVTPTNKAADEVTMRICRNLKKMNMLTTPEGCMVYRGGRGAGSKLSKEFPECLRDAAYASLYDAKLRLIEELLEKREEALHQKNFALASMITKKIQGIKASLPDETTFTVTQGFSRIIVLTTFKALSLVGYGEVPVCVSKVIVDEAGMVSRATTAAMMTIGRSAMLAGDPKQIGPIFGGQPGSSEEIRTWLISSGLSHLTSAQESLAMPHVRFLNKQHRMHPDISQVVSKFTYDGILEDAEELITSLRESPDDPVLPIPRNACIVLDWIFRRPDEIHAKRAAIGMGWERDFSAQIAAGLAHEACRKGAEVLILTPYRAQASLIRNKVRPFDREARKKISVGTIHKLQGAECDVVILDTVNGALSWPENEIEMLLNVAVSRSKKHFILIASHYEMSTPVLVRLASLLKMISLDFPIYDEQGGQINLPQKKRIPLPKSSVMLKGESAEMTSNPGKEINNAILSFAFNMALDPKNHYSKTATGLLELLKVKELSKQGLLIRAEDSHTGLYEARYATSRGNAPIVIQTKSAGIYPELCKEVRRLIEEEKVHPGSIMVITTKMPDRVADELSKVGIKAKAYDKNVGIEPEKRPTIEFDHVRCMTVYSSKGHEAPIVMFAGLQELEDLSWITDVPSDQLKRRRRSIMYEAFTRAMVRLYIYGSDSPFMNAARAYAGQDVPIQMLS